MSLGGMALLYAYFTGHKPEWLRVPVFAVASFYGDPRYFSMIQTNLIDELGAILSIFGLLILFFSRFRHEKDAVYLSHRIKAVYQSFWITAIAWLAIFLLVYGYAIFVVSSTVFGLFLLCLNIHFHMQVLLIRRKQGAS